MTQAASSEDNGVAARPAAKAAGMNLGGPGAYAEAALQQDSKDSGGGGDWGGGNDASGNAAEAQPASNDASGGWNSNSAWNSKYNSGWNSNSGWGSSGWGESSWGKGGSQQVAANMAA